MLILIAELALKSDQATSSRLALIGSGSIAAGVLLSYASHFAAGEIARLFSANAIYGNVLRILNFSTCLEKFACDRLAKKHLSGFPLRKCRRASPFISMRL